MLLGWINRADSALLSAGSEIATLPGANVQHAHWTRKWYTAAGVKSSFLLLDMGSALACALLAVLGTNFTSAATVRLRASTADPTAAAGDLLDTGTIAAGVKAGYGAIYKAFGSVTARYWRLDLADATLPDNLRVGRLFLGPSWQPAINMQLGWSVAPIDDSERDQAWSGEEYADVKPPRRMIQLTLDYMNEAEMFGNAFAMARAAGVTRDVLAVPDVSGAYLSEQAVYGALQALEPIVEDKLGLYRQRFTIRERIDDLQS